MHPILSGVSRATAGRVDPKYATLLVSVFMAIAMSLVISLVQTTIRLGFTPTLVETWLTSFGTSLVIAIPTSILVGPHAQRLARHLTGPPRHPAQNDVGVDRRTRSRRLCNET